MDFRLPLFLPILLASFDILASVATNDLFGPTIRLKVHLGSWRPGCISKTFEKSSRPEGKNHRSILTLDRPDNNVCPLIVVDAAWKCDETADKDSCSSEGIALVAAKGKDVGKLKVYRHKFTRPTRNVVVTICAGRGVEMIKKPLRPAYFYSLEFPNNLALKINTGENLKPFDAVWEYIASYARNNRGEDNWSPKAMDIINKGVATVGLSKVEVNPSSEKGFIPIPLSNAGREGSAGQYVFGVIHKKHGKWRTFITDPPTSPGRFTKYTRIALSCPQGAPGELQLEILPFDNKAELFTYIVVLHQDAQVTEFSRENGKGVAISLGNDDTDSLLLHFDNTCSLPFASVPAKEVDTS